MPAPEARRFAVVGAGAVGCYYGARLALAGHPVTLIGRPALVAAVEAGGLVLETAAGRETIAVEARADAAGVAQADVVLVCVKSTDTEEAGRAIAPHLAPGALVLSLQNGIDNAGRLAAATGRPVIPAVVHVASAMAGPAHVRHNGRGELILGPAPGSGTLAAALTAACIPTAVSERVRDELWIKLTINCAWNAFSALTDLPYGRLIRGEGVPAVLSDVVAECVAVAAAGGVALPADIRDVVFAVAGNMAGQRSSTAQDLARGRRTEIDHLNGFVVREGERLGVATPANRVLHTLVKLAEGGDGAPD